MMTSVLFWLAGFWLAGFTVGFGAGDLLSTYLRTENDKR